MFFLYFNSIKVQLKRAYGSLVYLDEKFQFHKGTIKTTFPVYLCDINYISIP